MSEECTHNCSTCSSSGSCSEKQDFTEKLAEGSKVKHVYAVMSGKGGVGKSLVTSLMAANFQKKGYRTAILDADITGPSIPRAFGVDGFGLDVTPDGKLMVPAVSMNGTQIVSANLLLKNDTDPIIWRGSLIASAVKQFWGETFWNEVDYMFVDMPPGTGDVPLTVFQSVPLDGIIVVTTPQDLVNMVVMKAVNMANQMNIPILGIVENMAYFSCEECGCRNYPFGKGDVQGLANNLDIPYALELPINPDYAKLSDLGRIEFVDNDDMNDFAQALIDHLDNQ